VQIDPVAGGERVPGAVGLPPAGVQYCVNCTKFGKLIIRKVTKIVATRCRILQLKCVKFDFGCGCAPDPAGELTALPQTP